MNHKNGRSFTTTIRSVWNRIPENSAKRVLRRFVRAGRSILPSRFDDSYVAELDLLDVAEAGVAEDGAPWLRLGDGTVLFGARPLESKAYNWYKDDRAAYARLPAHLRGKIPEECIRLALDVILRYKYPHATPDITPPYPFETRRSCWFGQHSDTIDDFAGLSEAERTRLKERFRIRGGDVVLDVGACYGFGALRYSRMVEQNGRVISVEVDPMIQAFFERNMKANNIGNVDLVRCGVWKEDGELSLHVGSIHRQDNSLKSGVYPSDETVTVPTRTIDSIVLSSGVSRVDLVSITINTAEVEAVEGMRDTLARFRPNLSIAGWLKRDDDTPVHAALKRLLEGVPGYRVEVGPVGRVLAWYEGETR